MSFRDAEKCFEDNIRLTGEAISDPVNFNLNNGLRMIAEQMNRDMAALGSEMITLRREVAELRRLSGR